MESKMENTLHIESRSGHLHLATIDNEGKIYLLGRPLGDRVTKEMKKQFKRDGTMLNATVNLNGATGSDDDLRPAWFANTNVAARANAVAAAVQVSKRPVVKGHDLPPTESTGIAVEHPVEIGKATTFAELDLLTAFKFVNADNDLVTAVKVGRSTAIAPVKVLNRNGIVSVFTRTYVGVRDGDDHAEKIRLTKNTQVAIIFPKKREVE